MFVIFMKVLRKSVQCSWMRLTRDYGVSVHIWNNYIVIVRAYICIYIYIYIIICIYIYIFINVILSIYLGSRYTFYSMLYMVVRYPDVCWLRLLRGTGRPSNLCWRGTWAPWEGRSWPKPGPTQEFSANEAGKCNSSPDPKIWPNYNISPT